MIEQRNEDTARVNSGIDERKETPANAKSSVSLLSKKLRPTAAAAARASLKRKLSTTGRPIGTGRRRRYVETTARVAFGDPGESDTPRMTPFFK